MQSEWKSKESKLCEQYLEDDLVDHSNMGLCVQECAWRVGAVLCRAGKEVR